jgi:LAO/AO transport system kinase
MATRGHLGGLARATNDILDLLDGAGYDPLLVETVGVGQDEVDVVRTADVVVVVLVPGMGDDIQALKAGILEIADVFAINKADRPGADRLEADLAAMLSLGSAGGRPRPPIVRTVAVEDRGLAELGEAIAAVVRSRDPSRRAARRLERAEARLLGLVGERVVERVRHELLPGEAYAALLAELAERRVDPYTAARQVLERLEVR